MSNLFNAKLIISSYDIINDNEWSIKSKIVDNTGNFVANNAQVGNIIYIDDFIGNMVLRYKITSINLASGSKLYANIIWDENDIIPIEPLIGTEAVIGSASNNLGLASLTSATNNNVSEAFITAIKNYENFEIIDKISKPSEFISFKTYIADEDIEAYKFVYITKGINVSKAGDKNINSADKIIGITLESAVAGEPIKVQINGKVTNSNWNFAETGKNIFISRNGGFKTYPDSSAKFVQQLGIIVSNDTIDLDFEEAVII